MKYRTCTAAEAASHGHDSRAGASSHGIMSKAIRPAAAERPTVSSCLSLLAFTSAFQPACSSAAPSTASVTGVEMSKLAEYLLEQRPHALDGRTALDDRFLRAMEIHRGEIRQQGREEHVGG